MHSHSILHQFLVSFSYLMIVPLNASIQAFDCSTLYLFSLYSLSSKYVYSIVSFFVFLGLAFTFNSIPSPLHSFLKPSLSNPGSAFKKTPSNETSADSNNSSICLKILLMSNKSLCSPFCGSPTQSGKPLLSLKIKLLLVLQDFLPW